MNYIYQISGVAIHCESRLINSGDTESLLHTTRLDIVKGGK